MPWDDATEIIIMIICHQPRDHFHMHHHVLYLLEFSINLKHESSSYHVIDFSGVVGLTASCGIKTTGHRHQCVHLPSALLVILKCRILYIALVIVCCQRTVETQGEDHQAMQLHSITYNWSEFIGYEQLQVFYNNDFRISKKALYFVSFITL